MFTPIKMVDDVCFSVYKCCTFLSRPYTTMTNKKNNKRKRGFGAIIDGEVESASTVTPKTIFETKEDGTTIAIQAWESLDAPNPQGTAVDNLTDMPSSSQCYDPIDIPSTPPQPEKRHTHKVHFFVINLHSRTHVPTSPDPAELCPAVRGPH